MNMDDNSYINCVLNNKWLGSNDDSSAGLLDGWYFFDGTGDVHGPFSTRDETVECLKHYCQLLQDQDNER